MYWEGAGATDERMSQNVGGGVGIGDRKKGEWEGRKGEGKERGWWEPGEGKRRKRGGRRGNRRGKRIQGGREGERNRGGRGIIEGEGVAWKEGKK